MNPGRYDSNIQFSTSLVGEGLKGGGCSVNVGLFETHSRCIRHLGCTINCTAGQVGVCAAPAACLPTLDSAGAGGRSYKNHYLCFNKGVCAFCELLSVTESWIQGAFSFLLTHRDPVSVEFSSECILPLSQAAYTSDARSSGSCSMLSLLA